MPGAFVFSKIAFPLFSCNDCLTGFSFSSRTAGAKKTGVAYFTKAPGENVH